MRCLEAARLPRLVAACLEDGQSIRVEAGPHVELYALFKEIAPLVRVLAAPLEALDHLGIDEVTLAGIRAEASVAARDGGELLAAA